MFNPRILVVDDDKNLTQLFHNYLKQAGYQVIAANSGGEAHDLICVEKPDLILLDLILPDVDGREIIRFVRNTPDLEMIPIIVLSALYNDEDKILTLEMGADDYVTKPYNPREVLARIRARLRNEPNLNPLAFSRMIRAGCLTTDVGRHRVTVGSHNLNLTATEFGLFYALLEKSGCVLTRTDLIHNAMGKEFSGIARTLDSHIRNLRRKLDATPENPVSIITIYGIGYQLMVNNAQPAQTVGHFAYPNDDQTALVI